MGKNLKNKGFKRITIIDIAKLAGVSKTTVSRVLSNNGLVKKNTQNKVLEVINKCNYKPSMIARSLKTRRTETIGAIVADIDNPFYSRVAKGIIDTAEKANYTVILCNSNFDMETERKNIETLISKGVDGLLIMTVELKRSVRDSLIKNNIPFILIDYKIDLPGIGYVANDDYYGGKIATEYLVSLGHKEIFFLGNIKLLSFKDRYRGIRETLEKKGLNVKIPKNSIKQISDVSDIVRDLIINKKNVTAIFAASDRLALKAIKTINDMGLSIPEDISVIGYDDIEITEMLKVPLTTVRQPKYRLGKLAVEQLVGILQGSLSASKIILKPELVIRESCRRI